MLRMITTAPNKWAAKLVHATETIGASCPWV